MSSHTPKGTGSQDASLTDETLHEVSGGEGSTVEFTGGVFDGANA